MTTADPNTLLWVEFPPYLHFDHATLAGVDPATTPAQPWTHTALARAETRNRPAPRVSASNAVWPPCSNTGNIHPRMERCPKRELDG